MGNLVKPKEHGQQSILTDFLLLTFGALLLVAGTHFFKFPNHFSYGGVSGLAVVLEAFVPWTAGTITMAFNFFFLILGFICLNREFGIKTIYVTILVSVGLKVMDYIYPMTAPFTDEPVLELIFTIVCQGVSAGILFNQGASSGGTDILAMILKKHSTIEIGTALIVTDALVTISSFYIYGPTTGLFSVAGLLAKSIMLDNAIANLNLSKYFTIVCDDPEPILKYIKEELDRSATVYHAEGAYSGTEKTVVMSVVKPAEAVHLRNYIRQEQPTAFLMVTNSSEIMGKGFRRL